MVQRAAVPRGTIDRRRWARRRGRSTCGAADLERRRMQNWTKRRSL